MKRPRDEAHELRRLFFAGAWIVFIVGAAAHFLFDAIGRWAPLGWVAPVNESLWEHIKMAFWPTLLVDGVLNRRLPSVAHRLVCTAASAWTSTLLIVPLFHAYTSILGRHYLLADVAIFAIAIAAGHFIAYRIAVGLVPSRSSVLAAAVLVISLGAALVAFTYAPPAMDVFRDSLTGAYGMGAGHEAH